jgi:hypothetical protein
VQAYTLLDLQIQQPEKLTDVQGVFSRTVPWLANTRNLTSKCGLIALGWALASHFVANTIDEQALKI